MPQRMTTPYNENYIMQTNYTIHNTVNWHEYSFIIPHYSTKPLHDRTTVDSQRAKSNTSFTFHISLKRVFSTRSHLLHCIDEKRPTSVKTIQSWPTRCIYQVCTPPLYLHLYRRIITWPWQMRSEILSQCRDFRIGVMCWNFGVFVTALAAEFRTSWRRSSWCAGRLRNNELQ